MYINVMKQHTKLIAQMVWTVPESVLIISLMLKTIYIYIFYLYTLAVFRPVWGVADNTKETTKTMGISLRSSSSDEGPSRVWMALLEQQSPSSNRLPQLTSLHRCHLPYCPYHRVA